jgi:hypothetical protein
MKAFDVSYELSALSTASRPGMRSRRVVASSADRAAEKVADEHNFRVNGRDFWVHSVRELLPGSKWPA